MFYLLLYCGIIKGMKIYRREVNLKMKHFKTINKGHLQESAVKGGCGECQASCQSACKTSCTVANQKCEK